ncbi:MAG: DUF2177 family protein [Bacteroidetes bacterium]|nr:DUF2177 family protein [Bacteroidota bacterium]
MAYYLKLYFATLTVFFAVDMLWLGVISRTFYKKHLGFIMSPDINWYAALIFYLLFIFGILVFVVLPGLKENALPLMLVKAALFGLITYATYDLTNLATVKDWPLIITLVDLVWGMVLTTVVSLAGFFIGRWLA